MPPISTIQFTQEQARTLTGASVETIRHWRKVVPYLGGKPGKSARFSFADVVGLAVTRELIDSFGVRISSVSAGVEALFQLLSEARPGAFESGIALVTTRGASIVRPEEPIRPRLEESGLVVPLHPLIASIRERMLPSPPASDQARLPFPPQMARGRK
jgi:hypothetical protein